MQRSTALEEFGVDMANLDAAPTRVHARDQLCSGQHTKPVCACYRPAIALAVQTIIRTGACYRTLHMLPIRQRERLEGFPDATIRSERAPCSTDHFFPRYGPLICTCAKISVIIHMSRARTSFTLLPLTTTITLRCRLENKVKAQVPLRRKCFSPPPFFF